MCKITLDMLKKSLLTIREEQCSEIRDNVLHQCANRIRRRMSSRTCTFSDREGFRLCLSLARVRIRSRWWHSPFTSYGYLYIFWRCRTTWLRLEHDDSTLQNSKCGLWSSKPLFFTYLLNRQGHHSNRTWKDLVDFALWFVKGPRLVTSEYWVPSPDSSGAWPGILGDSVKQARRLALQKAGYHIPVTAHQIWYLPLLKMNRPCECYQSWFCGDILSWKKLITWLSGILLVTWPESGVDHWNGCPQKVARSYKLITCRNRWYANFDFSDKTHRSGSITNMYISFLIGVGPSTAANIRSSMELQGSEGRKVLQP